MSTNPYLAAFLAEVLAAYAAAAPAAEPLDIVELGAGSGKLAFHILRELGDKAAVRYILTDVAPDLLDYWAAHPQLRPLVDQGNLDFAVFDVERPAPLTLAVSGDVVGAATAAGDRRRRVALVASYCLDSVAQDVFHIDDDGELWECLVTYTGPPGRPDEALLDYEMRPCGARPYADPALDELVAGWRATARGITLTFPRAALACFDFFASRWPGGLLALVGDRGFVRPEHSLPLSAVEPTRHGSVSLPVNFGAISGWFAGRGGAAEHPPHRAQSYNVSCFTVGDGCASARTAYRNAVRTRDPDTFFILKKAAQARYADLSLRETVAFLRLSHWDTEVFAGMFPHLLERLQEPLDAEDVDEIRHAVGELAENHFPVRDDDVPFMLGTVAYAAGEYAEALALFARSIDAGGGSADCWLNCALCHEMLGQRDRAIDCVYQALVADPSVPEPADLLERLRDGAPAPG